GDVMRSRAGFHPDQAAWNVGEPALELSARALQLQNDRSALIEADKVEAILAEVDADRAHGGGCCGFVSHGTCSLCFSIPRKTLRLAGWEHGRAIPLADICSAANCIAISIGLSWKLLGMPCVTVSSIRVHALDLPGARRGAGRTAADHRGAVQKPLQQLPA